MGKLPCFNNKKTTKTVVQKPKKIMSKPLLTGIASTTDSVNTIKTVGQTLCDLRAIRATLNRTQQRGLTPVYYPVLFETINFNIKSLSELLSNVGTRIDIWILRMLSASRVQDPFFIGATEQAVWKQLQEWVNVNWDECMYQAPKPADPHEMVNEFLEHSGAQIECECVPLPFVTSLPESKNVDS